LSLKLGAKLPAQPTVIDQLMNRRGEYEGALKVEDRAVAAKQRPDLTAMRALLDDMLQKQIATVAPIAPPAGL
jgi:hypothetical protein